MARQAAQQKSLEQTFLQLEKLLMTIIPSFWRLPRILAIIYSSNSLKALIRANLEKQENCNILHRFALSLLSHSTLWKSYCKWKRQMGKQKTYSPSALFCIRPIQVEQKSCMSPFNSYTVRKFLTGQLMESKPLHPFHPHFLLHKISSAWI